MVEWIGPPVVWAQATASDANSLAALALRRWCASLTLSSPEWVPSLYGLWAWLSGLAALLLLVAVVQGPFRALRQLFDLPGHLRLVSASVGRLRRSGRVVAVIVGMTVLAWTASQVRTYNREQGRADLILLTKSRSLVELSVEQGIMAALTPVRDVLGLGDNLPLLIVATLLLFGYAAEGWGTPSYASARARVRPSGWRNVAWVSTALYLLYRLISIASDTGDLPLGGCLTLEVVGVPLIMLLADGIVLAWVLVELRNASLGESETGALDTTPSVGLMPGAALACLVGLPAHYLSTMVLLASLYLPSTVAEMAPGRYMRWQLNWGLADLQGASLVLVGMAGAVAWSRGSPGGAVRGFGRLLAAEGGHLLAGLVLSGLAAGGISAVAYALVLSLPPQAWVLAAADGYAHYGTLPVGLLTLAALVELGERSLPEATVAGMPTGEPAAA